MSEPYYEDEYIVCHVDGCLVKVDNHGDTCVSRFAAKNNIDMGTYDSWCKAFEKLKPSRMESAAVKTKTERQSKTVSVRGERVEALEIDRRSRCIGCFNEYPAGTTFFLFVVWRQRWYCETCITMVCEAFQKTKGIKPTPEIFISRATLTSKLEAGTEQYFSDKLALLEEEAKMLESRNKQKPEGLFKLS